MNLSHIFALANESGGTLYLMLLLLLVALTVIIERHRFLLNMQNGGEQLIEMLQKSGHNATLALPEKLAQLPHAPLFAIMQNEPLSSGDRSTLGGHLEEAIMHEVPTLDRSLWMLDTVITLAPLLGLFGTIIGMFNAFHALGDVQNDATQVTGGIAEALIATASGLFIAMIGLVFFNALQTRVRIILHQLETIKVMLLNRHDEIKTHATKTMTGRGPVELVQAQARA
jgi:biopolymer transport protein ExbB